MNSKGEYYPFKDVWNYEIDLIASTAVLSKKDTSFELFSKQITQMNFCWALDVAKQKWFIQKQSESGGITTKSEIRLMGTSDDNFNGLQGLIIDSISDGCALSANDGNIASLGISNTNELIFSLSNRPDTGPNIIDSIFGVNFCKDSTSGGLCQFNC